jgi:cytochrome c
MMKLLALMIAAAGIALSAPALASEQLAQKGLCMGCHAKDKKMVGPAYSEVAAKYKDQKDAVAKLSEKVRKGGTGVWGQIPMPPNGTDKLSDAELKSVVEWILKGA